MKRNQGGFTLVEMMVTIVIGSLVTLAATTVLLLGLRINNRSTQTVTRQNTARVVITMLENLAAEGEITDIISEKNQEDKVTAWEIRNAENVVLATYSEQAIYIGGTEKDEGEAPATPLLENVTESTVSLDKTGLLSISLVIDDTPYESSIYCRTMREPKENELEHQAAASNPKVTDKTGMSAIEEEGRNRFLNVLASQYRLKGGSPNPGLILDGGFSTGEYYSEWYVGGYDEKTKPGWDIETPWCACFVSWGLSYYEEVRVCIRQKSWNIQPASGIVGGVAFANVDFFASYFKNPGEGQGQRWADAVLPETDNVYYLPVPGDIIFIDWDGNRDDPAHVGVVLKVETKTMGDKTVPDSVYTIEGNRENRVMVCKYTVGENYDIVMGYGIIDWKS